MKKRAASPAAAAAATIESVAATSSPENLPAATSAWDRENPKKLSGDALRAFAHRQGMAKSDLVAMPDEKIRTQLHYITARRYADEVV